MNESNNDLAAARAFLELSDNLREKAFSCEVLAPENPFMTLTVSQARVFRFLCVTTRENPEGIKLKELADQLKVSPAAASEMVEVLVRKGVLERQQSETDRRAVNIRLSENSSRKRENVETAFAQEWCFLWQDFSEAEKTTFSRLLGKLKKRMNEGK